MIWGIHYFTTKLKTKIDVIPRGCFKNLRQAPGHRVLDAECSFYCWASVVMLGLHYVHGGHVCSKRSAPWDFVPFFNFYYVLLRFLTVCHGLSRYAGRTLTGRRWSTPGDSKARYGSARSAPDLLRMPVRCLPGRHGLMGLLAFLTF